MTKRGKRKVTPEPQPPEESAPSEPENPAPGAPDRGTPPKLDRALIEEIIEDHREALERLAKR